MWLKIPESRLCPNCDIPVEHWALYGQSGRTAGEATFCPICYPDVKGVFETLETSRAFKSAGTAIQMPDAA